MKVSEVSQSVQENLSRIVSRRAIPEIFSNNILNNELQERETQASFKAVEPKAVRMMKMYANAAYIESRAMWRFHLKLISWFFIRKINKQAKRILDLVLSIIALPFALPLMLLTAIAIKLDSPGPVFFKQERVGKWGKRFTCYKFRSMVVNAEDRKKELLTQNEADKIVFKIKEDPRVTRVGKIIRKLSIDELPQIFNILKGDMSLVGPRPPVPIEVEQYQVDHYRRLEVIPGLTGLQQISGRSELPFARWVELDVQYIEEQNLLKDLEIIIKTIPAVISRRGAY